MLEAPVHSQEILPEQISPDLPVDPDAGYRQTVAIRALSILRTTQGDPTEDFCHMVETYRMHTGTFPLPLEHLPCLECPRRTEGK